MPLHISTPLLPSAALCRRSDASVWLKIEALQPSGSFKMRGIGFACEEYHRRGACRFVSSSGGNAGLAVAYAARMLSVPATVVVPQSASARARELLRREGAEVVAHGASWQEANALALSLVGPNDAFVHPFDDPLLWQGHATMIDEVAQAGIGPDAVVLSVGGGGLLCGVIEGLRRNGWSHVPVVAVETEGAASFHQSVQAGHRVELASITSIATTLGAKQICAKAFELAQEHPVRSVVVSDAQAVAACLRFLDDHRLLVEPACGAALAAVYDAVPDVAQFCQILVIVCGGAGVTSAQLHAWSQQLGQPTVLA